MTLPRLDGMFRYWRSHPPQHILLAAHVGFKAPDKKANKKKNDLDALKQIFQQSGGKVVTNGRK